ncbi:putative RNA-directed DNA polymerase, eukaryota, reverse transcriptase zinc-binding domain protein [Tanacetum coccineum]
MASTRANISKASKRPKINIILPKQLFVDITHDDIKTPSPTLQLSSPRSEDETSVLNIPGLFSNRLEPVKAGHMVRIVLDMREFFSSEKLLKEINHTIIALLPKVKIPSQVNDYLPISCSNVLYKCISKIITNRIKEGLNDIVSDNQSAFVLSRRIIDNILITQELMHNYHLDRGPHRCAFKVDIQKAYDTID